MNNTIHTPLWNDLVPRGLIFHERGGWTFQEGNYNQKTSTIYTIYTHTNGRRLYIYSHPNINNSMIALLTDAHCNTIQHYRMKMGRMYRCTPAQYEFGWGN